MSKPVERVDIPCGGSALAAFRAFRAWAEQVAASQGNPSTRTGTRTTPKASKQTLHTGNRPMNDVTTDIPQEKDPR